MMAVNALKKDLTTVQQTITKSFRTGPMTVINVPSTRFVSSIN